MFNRELERHYLWIDLVFSFQNGESYDHFSAHVIDFFAHKQILNLWSFRKTSWFHPNSDIELLCWNACFQLKDLRSVCAYFCIFLQEVLIARNFEVRCIIDLICSKSILQCNQIFIVWWMIKVYFPYLLHFFLHTFCFSFYHDCLTVSHIAFIKFVSIEISVERHIKW